jgi:hypothetical protein
MDKPVLTHLNFQDGTTSDGGGWNIVPLSKNILLLNKMTGSSPASFKKLSKNMSQLLGY